MYNVQAMAKGKNSAEGSTKLEYPPKDEVTELTDTEIIALFNSRDEKALSEVSGKYGVSCLRIAGNILKNHEDAQECVNDTYLKVWESIPPERPESLSAYVAQLTRNAAIDRYRSEHSEKRGGGEIPLILDELTECISDNGSIEHTAEDHELLDVINEFLETLPAERRIAFVSRYTLCESVRSIAQRLGVTQNKISVNLNRTRKALVEYLKRKGFEI